MTVWHWHPRAKAAQTRRIGEPDGWEGPCVNSRIHHMPNAATGTARASLRRGRMAIRPKRGDV